MLVAIGPIGVLPRPDGVHAEPLDDGADRLRLLLRLLRLRAALPRPVPGRAAGAGLRARAGRAARLPRHRDRRCADRRRRTCSTSGSPAPFLAASGSRHRRVPRARSSSSRRTAVTDASSRACGTYVRALVARAARATRTWARSSLANAAWEGTFAGARTFVVLYVTVGLGEPLSTSTYVLAAVAGGYIVGRARRGPHRRPRRPRAGDHRRVGRVRDGLVAGGLATGVARLVPRAHLPRRDRRRHRDDARVGAALQADAVGRAWRDLGPRDDDEGRGPRHRPARRGRC